MNNQQGPNFSAKVVGNTSDQSSENDLNLNLGNWTTTEISPTPKSNETEKRSEVAPRQDEIIEATLPPSLTPDQEKATQNPGLESAATVVANSSGTGSTPTGKELYRDAKKEEVQTLGGADNAGQYYENIIAIRDNSGESANE